MALHNPIKFRSNAFDNATSGIGKDDVPDELNIFFRNEEFFLPDGKTWADLTEEEKKLAKERYRFDPMRPGMYQTLTGFGGMI